MESKPNILLLLSDQHNPHVAGFAGDSIVQTMNLDRLSSASAQFDNAYCQTPLCTPSRVSLWTGKLPHLVGGWKNNSPIFPEHLTIPEHFGCHGYVTCGIGKMHVGGERPMNGFAYRPYGDLKPNRFCSHQPDPIRMAEDNIWTSHQAARLPFAGVSEIPESMMQDSVVTREALTFIREHTAKNPEKPWFLCASYQRPHHPLTAPERYIRRYMTDGPELQPLPEGYPVRIHPHDRFIVEDFRLTVISDEERRKGLAAYYASVDFLDDCIGDLLEGLDREGQLDNTIIVYTSDHGDLASEHGLWWKRSYYDGSAGVPLLIHVPGGTAKTSRVSDVVELLDLFPTLCDLCGVPQPDGLHGESLVPLMGRGSGARHKDSARSQYIARMETTFRMIRTAEWKYVEFPEYPPVLFDMVNDPGEERSIAHLPEYDTVMDDMRRRLWSDGESWETLRALRQADIERAEAMAGKHEDCSPNQYALSNGELIDAEWTLYAPYLGQR